MADQTYDLKAKLTVPDVATKSITVRIEVEPPSARYVIAGFVDTAEVIELSFSGPYPAAKLPFVSPEIYVRFLDPNTKFAVSVLGWAE